MTLPDRFGVLFFSFSFILLLRRRPPVRLLISAFYIVLVLFSLEKLDPEKWAGLFGLVLPAAPCLSVATPQEEKYNKRN